MKLSCVKTACSDMESRHYIKREFPTILRDITEGMDADGFLSMSMRKYPLEQSVNNGGGKKNS